MHIKWLILSVLTAAMLVGAGNGIAGITATKHNLSATGPGTYKSTQEVDLCFYCHAPHNDTPSVPLWNHAASGATYVPYTSSTLVAAAPGQPTGASKLCLHCHDGTVALGSVNELAYGDSGAGVLGGLSSFLQGSSPAYVGSDLSHNHPISFTYDTGTATDNPELVDPVNLTGDIRPDGGGRLQCTSCHDPHSDTYPYFLRAASVDGAGYGSPLCRTCHNKNYWGTVANNPHRESMRQWNGAGDNPWHVAGQNLANDSGSTVKVNACENCHQPHNASGANRLLKQDGESGVCLVCHNGNVAVSDLETELTNTYTHPIRTTSNSVQMGLHNPKRMPDGTVREDPADLGVRHVVCADCHNPHAVSARNTQLPVSNLASSVLKGVWGVEPSWPGSWGTVSNYTTVSDVTYQYQLCLKCHSYYAFGPIPPSDPDGLIAGGVNTDQAQEFNPNNESYHPVVAQGKNPFTMTVGGTTYDYSASLINGMTPTSTITCSECHSNPTPATPDLKGPHGSPNHSILKAPFDENTGQPGTDDDLCFQCHDKDVFTGGRYEWQRTGFSGVCERGEASSILECREPGVRQNLHYVHTVGEKWCSACHPDYFMAGMERRYDPPQLSCKGCHAAVPHGWKRKRLLIFGASGSNPVLTPDPPPYNDHGGDWGGIPSSLDLDSIQSGNWKVTDCHRVVGGSFNSNHCAPPGYGAPLRQ